MAKIISTKGKQFRIAMDDGTFLDQPKKKHKTKFRIGDQVDVFQDGSETHVLHKFPDRYQSTKILSRIVKVVFSLLAILIVLIFILALMPEEEKEKVIEPKIGEELIVKNVSYKVLEVKNASKLGSGWIVTADGKFFIILLEIQNKDREAIFVDTDQFYLRLGENSYSPCINCSMYYSDDDYKALNREGMNPGIKIKAVLVYDVPSELAESKEFKLKVSDHSFGSSSGIIDLSNR